MTGEICENTVTGKLYENNSYIKVFEASVTDCRPAGEICEGWKDASGGDWAIALDVTAFFPEGGGQNADTGSFCRHDRAAMSDVCSGEEKCFKVYDVQLKDGTVYHRTDLWADKGTQVLGRLDWEARFSNMQQHSGEHIFSGLVHRYFGYHNVGFHLGSQTVTMDFDGLLTNEDIDRIEWEVNEAIYKNVPITVSYPNPEALKTLSYRSKIEIEGQVRIVTVEGYDVCACCAPHVAHTGEIGLLKVIDMQKYKGGVRVSILCGSRALEDYRNKQDEGQKISRLLSAPGDGLAKAVQHQLEESTKLRQKIYELNQQLITAKIEAIPRNQEDVWFFEDAMDTNTMRKTVNRALEKIDGCCGVFSGDDSVGYNYIIGTKTKDATKAASMLKEKFKARGGGRAEMVQGHVDAVRRDIEDALQVR